MYSPIKLIDLFDLLLFYCRVQQGTILLNVKEPYNAKCESVLSIPTDRISFCAGYYYLPNKKEMLISRIPSSGQYIL